MPHLQQSTTYLGVVCTCVMYKCHLDLNASIFDANLNWWLVPWDSLPCFLLTQNMYLTCESVLLQWGLLAFFCNVQDFEYQSFRAVQFFISFHQGVTQCVVLSCFFSFLEFNTNSLLLDSQKCCVLVVQVMLVSLSRLRAWGSLANSVHRLVLEIKILQEIINSGRGSNLMKETAWVRL